MSDDFVALDSDGSMRTKSEVLARVKKAKWTTNEIGDLKVTVHGDAAVATGTWTGAFRGQLGHRGQPAPEPSYYAVRGAVALRGDRCRDDRRLEFRKGKDTGAAETAPVPKDAG